MSNQNGKARSAMWDAIAACRRHLVFAAIFSAALNVLYLVPTLYMLQVYDRVVPSRSHLSLFFLTIALMVSLFVLSTLDFVRGRLLVRASVMLDKMLVKSVIDSVFSRFSSSDPALASRATREFDVFRHSVTGPGILAVCDLPWTPIYILISFLIHPVLGSLAFAGVILLAALAYLNERMTHKPLKSAADASNLSYLSLEQSIANADVIRALGMRSALVQRHLAERVQSTRLQLEASFAASGHVALARFVRLALQSLSLGLGAYLAIEQKISAGGIFAASLLVGRALAPIDQILAASKSLAQGRDAFENLEKMLASRTEGEAPTQLPVPTGHIAVDQLGVLNASRDSIVLDGVSFSVTAGEIIGIVGPSGAGKSTLVRAIAGAVKADKGVIRFDGANVDHWDREQLARFVGFMPQDTALFAGTIKENISRFATEVSDGIDNIDAKVVAAAKLCGVHEMILRLPVGYDTKLTWGGRGLSSGHSQRIALSRALYDSPKVVILDEPNAHLDADGELMLLGALKELKKRGTTVLIVAHRTGVLPAIDRLLMLRDGRIEMFGPRDEVIKSLNAQSRPQHSARSQTPVRPL